MAGVPARSRLSFIDVNGKPIADGSVEVFYAGTEDHVDTFRDSELATKNENPIPLDGRGECVMFLTGFSTVKWVVRDKYGATVLTEDPVLVGGDKPLTPDFTVDHLSGDGVKTSFTLSTAPSSKNNTMVFVGTGYVSKDAYEVVDDILTFDTAPASGTNNIEVQTIQLVEFSASANLITEQADAAQASAEAAATSETNAATSETNAAASESAAAVSAASAASAAAKVSFTSTTTGLAGTVSGQTFAVVQSNGDGLDTYLNNAGTAVWQSAGAVGDLAMAEVVERIQPETYAPVASMLSWQTSVQNGRGALNSARPKSRVFGRNMNAYVYGPRTQVTGSVTVTPFFANGPTQTGTATRLQLTGTSGLFGLWTNAYRPPSGTYTVDFQVKSNTGSDIAIRTGNATDGWTARTAAGASWTRVQHQFTTNGTNWATFNVTGDGTNLPDILIDEMRIYEDTSANVPAIASDPQGDDFMPALGFRKTRHSGRLLDNTTTAAEGSGLLRVQGYPTAKVFSEITMIAAASMTTAAANQQLITTDYANSLSTTNSTLAITSTSADGAPDFSGMNSFFDYDMAGQGVVVLALAVRNGERRAYLNGVEIASDTDTFAGFSARMFRVGSNSGSEVGYTNSFRWQGLIAAAKVFDRYLTGDENGVEVEKVQAGLRAAGIPLAQMPGFLIALGDSQTASGSGVRGPSWAYLQADTGAFVPNLPVRVPALAGTTTQDAVAAQLPVALTMIEQALRQNIRPVVGIFTGTNNQNEIVADWNGGVSSFTSPTGWWAYTKANLIAPLVAAGAKVTFATQLPDGGTPPTNWEAARVAMNAKILADYSGSTSVFPMDFGGTAGLSTVADTAGVNFDTDHRHISTAGHLVLKPVVTAAVNAALDAP